MNSLRRFFNRYQLRTWLLVLAGLLLLAKLGSLTLDSYREKVADLETRQATLMQYRNVTSGATELRARLARLQASREKLITHLFRGDSEEEIISAMQLSLQALVTEAGLQSESIRPMQQRGIRGAEGGKGENLPGEVAIKARLIGTLGEFLDLTAGLERQEKFFKIESFSLSPYRKAGLKISLDLRGYFITNPDGNGGEGGHARPVSPAR